MTEGLTTTPVLARFVWADTSWQCTLIDDRTEPHKVLHVETCPTSTEAYFKCERWASENGCKIYRSERSRSEMNTALGDSDEES